MGRLIIIVLVTCAIYLPNGFCCSFTPRHPATLFCESDFVATVSIKESRLVYVGVDGSFKEKGTSTTVRRNIDDVQNLSNDAGSKLGQPEHKEKRDSDISSQNTDVIMNKNLRHKKSNNRKTKIGSLMKKGFLQKSHKGMIFNNDPFQYKYDPNDENMSIVAIKMVTPIIMEKKRNGRNSDSFDSLDHDSKADDSSHSLMRQYDVEMLEIFKGNGSYNKKFLYTMPDSGVCGYEFEEGTSYLVMGDVKGEAMLAASYSYVLNLNLLTQNQPNQIKEMLRRRKNDACDVCTVCALQCEENNNQCIWLDPREIYATEELFVECNKNKSGKCVWKPLTEENKEKQ